MNAVIFAWCVVMATAYDKYWLYKKQTFQKAIDVRTQTRSLGSCWIDFTGQCCANDISDCRYYRSSNMNALTRTRGNYFYFNTMAFYPGNFWYYSCKVQCVCSSKPPTCSITNTPLPVTTLVSTNPLATSVQTTAVTTTASTAASTTTSTVTSTLATTAAATTGSTLTTATTTPSTSTSSTTTSVATTTTSTSTTTTTTTTTTTPTTSVITRFCPAGVTTQSNRTRILNGTPLTSCSTFPGVVSVVDPATGLVVCTGLVTSSTTVSVPNNCAQLMGRPYELREPLSGNVIQTLPAINPATVPTGGPYTLTLTTPLAATSCPGIACLYTTAMVNNIDLNSCVVVGAGLSDNAGTTTATYSFMNVTTIQPTAICSGLLTASPQALLFDTTLTYNCFYSAASSTCVGDAGAPVMCPLSTGEIVVIGQVENFPCTGSAIIGAYNLQGGALRVLAPKEITLGTGNRRTRERIAFGARRNLKEETIAEMFDGSNEGRTNQGVRLGVAKIDIERNRVSSAINKHQNKNLYRGTLRHKIPVILGTNPTRRASVILGTRRAVKRRIQLDTKKQTAGAVRTLYRG